MKDKLSSRKFWFALLGAMLPVVAQYFSADLELQEAMKLSAGVIVAYIFGQGYVDGKAVESTVPPSQPDLGEA
tara:strand:+ start:1687 stop:1905 length:219 start_codon:yes stop_codon:yes gene_type:complete